MNGTIQVGHSIENKDVLVVIDGDRAMRLQAADAIDLGCSLIRNAIGSVRETLDGKQLDDAMRMFDIVNYWAGLVDEPAGAA